MKKLPKGISNYEELVTEGYYYVDKTNFIEKLENLEDKGKNKIGDTEIYK
ncbi:MAG: AAA family ATPase [Clostridia bacterium]|nr:AAA family ATPase [Clostridia bacterium]